MGGPRRLAPVPGGDQPGDHLPDLRGADLGLVILGPRRMASSTAVQEVRPGSSAATTEYGQPGIICACPFPRPYTWQNNLSGLVAAPGRSQLLTSTASISRPSAPRGNGSPRERAAQPGDIDPPAADRVIQRAVAAAVPRDQRQAGQVPDRAVRAQHRIRQLEDLIPAGGQAGTELAAEARQHGACKWPGTGALWQSVHHGLRGDHGIFGENT